MTLHGINLPDSFLQLFHVHPNGGGLIAPGTFVAESIEIGRDCFVIGGSITGDVRITNGSVVCGSQLHALDGQTLVVASSSLITVELTGGGDVYASLLTRITRGSVSSNAGGTVLTTANSSLQDVSLRGTVAVEHSTVEDCLVGDSTVIGYSVIGDPDKGDSILEGCRLTPDGTAIGFRRNVTTTRTRRSRS